MSLWSLFICETYYQRCHSSCSVCRWHYCDLAGIKEVKVHLNENFQIKDLGQLRYFLGVKVPRSKQGVFISRQMYIDDLLIDTGRLDSSIDDNVSSDVLLCIL